MPVTCPVIRQCGCGGQPNTNPRRYSYEFGDFVANALWSTYIHNVGDPRLEMPHPDLLSKVYDAFDAGEMADPQSRCTTQLQPAPIR